MKKDNSNTGRIVINFIQEYVVVPFGKKNSVFVKSGDVLQLAIRKNNLLLKCSSKTEFFNLFYVCIYYIFNYFPEYFQNQPNILCYSCCIGIHLQICIRVLYSYC